MTTAKLDLGGASATGSRHAGPDIGFLSSSLKWSEKGAGQVQKQFSFRFHCMLRQWASSLSSAAAVVSRDHVYKSLGSRPLPTTVNCPPNTKKTEVLRFGAIFNSPFIFTAL